MRRLALIALLVVPLALAQGAPKTHMVVFGKWTPVKLFLGPNEDKAMDMKIRSLYVDGRLREFTTGEPHDITDRVFVVRRAFRLNDSLPDDAAHKWRWQRGGWLLVNRDSGHISPLNLPLFDPFYSTASWYRDYAAYCGVSDDGEKLYAVVAQLSRRKPILRRELGPLADSDMPDSACPAPEWQRQPSRVTFEPTSGQKLTFAIHGHAADVAGDSDSGDDQ